MTSYSKGADFERACRDVLLAAGFAVVRATGSHTKIDLVAFRANELLFIQCKTNGIISPADRRELCRLASLIFDAVPIVAYKIAGIGAPQFRRLRSSDVKDFLTYSLEEST